MPGFGQATGFNKPTGFNALSAGFNTSVGFNSPTTSTPGVNYFLLLEDGVSRLILE
jgi:hypothetical protein